MDRKEGRERDGKRDAMKGRERVGKRESMDKAGMCVVKGAKKRYHVCVCVRACACVCVRAWLMVLVTRSGIEMGRLLHTP